MGAVPASASGVPRPSPPPTRGVLAPPPLNGEEKIFLLILFTVIAVVTGVAFILLGVVANTYYSTPVTSNLATGSVTFFGAGILAYTFGLRHGVDADHIAAIDNTTRKLMADGKRPLTVGTWFSLGHSTIVFVLSIGIVLAANYVNSHIGAIQSIGQILGTAISGGFLYLIGIINLIIVVEVYRIFKKLRTGRMNDAELEDHLRNRGFMNRYFGKMFNIVQTPRQVYPVGVLFGLGFDTASEIFLLGTVAVLGLAGAPVYVVLVLPLLFTCGMVLVDTADGATMRYAYGWAFHRPVRKIFYNLTVTIISVLVAFVIGTVELLQVLAIEFGWSGPFWSALVNLEFETLGYFVIGTFVVTWAIATAIYRINRYDSIEVATPPEPT
ncbi:MAG TPA: HoxN/HupN/NixA family nickel/cobalt transporter [Thermoplasmata archaeon]|nr:HoxN/HupN/NixA family nickel/cobalt transporter [Thermoplasmata archaeon]